MVATQKLSQIASAGSAPALTDSVVGVNSGAVDLRYTASQLASTILANGFPAQANDASIRAAALAASNAGGGIVHIPAGTIVLSSPLPAYSGVTYQGAPVQIQVPNGATTGIGGTILQGNGTFNGIEYNPTDLAAPLASTAVFLAGQLQGGGAKNITFVNFSYGIKIGALFNPGIALGVFEALNFIDCQQWGFWLENYTNCLGIFLSFNNNQVGQFARVNSGTALWNGGNSSWLECNAATAPSLLSRGFIWQLRSSSNTTQELAINESVNRTLLPTITQAATMSNVSANITITDGTKFPLDMPITWSASVNGFTASQIYFVVSQASNVIQVANTMRGAAITPSGNTAVNALTKGFALLEVSTLDSGSSFIGIKSYGLDLEGTATMHLLLQNIAENYTIEPSIIGGDVYQNAVFRSATRGSYINFTTGTDDIDQASVVYKISYDGTNLNYNLGNYIGGSVNGNFSGVFLTSAGQLDYGLAASGRWNFGKPILVGTSFPGSSSGNDAATFRKPGDNNYGYASWCASATNGNVGFALNQGSGNGGAGNSFIAFGIVGTNSDPFYGLSTSASGRASGDFIFQTFFGGAFHQAWYVPVGTVNVVFNGLIQQQTSIVSALPAPGTAGRRSFVTDATATTFASIVAGTGANAVPVYDDGTNWRIG